MLRLTCCCIARCAAVQVIGAYKLWSSPSTWPSGRVPAENSSVTISSLMSVIMDISPPKLAGLVIEGRLKFDNKTDLTLRVDSILVYGLLEVGTIAQPLTRNVKIEIYGVRTSRTVVADNWYFLGNKVLAVFGQLSMAGVPRDVTWTRLASVSRRHDGSRWRSLLAR
jgi:hypothetical protein